MSPLTAPRMPVRHVGLVVVTGALAAALGHTLVVLFQRHMLQRPSGASMDFALLSPVGYLLVFAVLAVPLVLLALVLPARVSALIVAFVSASTCAFALAILIPHIYWQALALIAIGVGSRIAGAYAQRGDGAPALTRRILIGVVGAQLLIIGLTAATRQLGAWRLDRARGVAAPGAPNVLLLILDTVRASSLSVYGYPRPTTLNVERLAAEGVLFEHAFTASSWSAPSHATMLTGLWGSETRASFMSRLRRDVPTLPELLNVRGYVTGSFVSNVVYAGRSSGFGRGFARVEDFHRSPSQALWSTSLLQTASGRRVFLAALQRDVSGIVRAIRHLDLRFANYVHRPRSSAEVVDGFWRWREEVGDRPYFGMLNLFDAHDPNPRGRFRSEFGNGATEVDRYDGSIAYLDSVVGSIADRLRERGELDRTILIITSDHGELLGEHGIHGHEKSIYGNVMRIPLIFRGGPTPRGVRVEAEVTNRDLSATILDLVDEGTQSRGELPGRSLRLAWTSGSNRDVSPVIIETTPGVNMQPGDLRTPGPIRGAVDSSWYYIRYGDGREEVFRWREDTLEARSLVGTAEGRAAADRLRVRMEKALGLGNVRGG